MRNNLRRLAALLLAFCVAAMAAPQALAVAAEPPAAAQADNMDYLADEVLITFTAGTGHDEIEGILDAAGCVFSHFFAEGEQGLFACANMDGARPLEAVIATLLAQPGVLAAQPNYLYPLIEDAPGADIAPQVDAQMDEAPAVATEVGSVNDPLAAAGGQWHLNRLQVFESWDLLDGITAEKVQVALLDTTIQLDHPDLAANLLAGLSADFSVDGTQKPYGLPTSDHGTHVAGLMGAVANNGLGGVGVASGYQNQVVEILPVNVFGSSLTASTSAMVAGINYAVSCGADVINMSLGYPRAGSPNRYDKLLEDAVDGAAQNGIPVVCAAGNTTAGGVTTTFFPSDFTNAFGVISLTSAERRSASSNYGDAKFISAPGEALPSTVPTSTYATKSGTSMAAPLVSGVIALMLYANGTLSFAEIEQTLADTATDLYTPQKDAESGWGRVDAKAAVEAALLAGGGQVPVRSIQLSTATLQLNVGDSQNLQASALPRNATDRSITWASSDERVASVDAQGLVTAHKRGTAVITAWAQQGTVSADCTVQVMQPVTGVTLAPAEASLRVGETMNLQATVGPEDANDQSLHWHSSNPAVASVSGTGALEARKIGTTTITVTTNDGGFTAESLVTVTTAEPGTILSSVTHYDGSPDAAPIGWTIDAKTESFVQLEVTDPDGWLEILVEFQDYTRTSGSVTLTLTQDYLNTLVDGNYEMEAVFVWGSVTDTFTIKSKGDDSEVDSSSDSSTSSSEPAPVPPGSEATGSPQTGDGQRAASHLAAALLGGGTLAALCVAWAGRRRRQAPWR